MSLIVGQIGMNPPPLPKMVNEFPKLSIWKGCPCQSQKMQNKQKSQSFNSNMEPAELDSELKNLEKVEKELNFNF